MSKFGLGRIAGIACLTVLAATGSEAVASDSPGFVWEMTSQNVMPGMPMQMPAQTMKVCAASEWTHPPASPNKECTTSNYARSGATATWTVTCAGQMAMTGRGEMTFDTPDSYVGSINFTSSQMNMTIKLTGRKTTESCASPQ